MVVTFLLIWDSKIIENSCHFRKGRRRYQMTLASNLNSR
jgi:hypothetical protein